MRMVIEAQIETTKGNDLRIPLSTNERAGSAEDAIGLSLAWGRALLANVQTRLVQVQFEAISALLAHCPNCGNTLTMKGRHQRRLRTVLG